MNCNKTSVFGLGIKKTAYRLMYTNNLAFVLTIFGHNYSNTVTYK